MKRAVSGTWFVVGAFALSGLGCHALEEGPRVYGPTETRLAADDVVRLGASWTGACHSTEPAIGSGTVSCPSVDFRSEVTCSRAGCAVVEQETEDGGRVLDVTLPPDPGPLDITVTLRRSDGDETHTESFPVDVHRLASVELQCSAAGCPADWAQVLSGERGAVEVGVVGVSQEDGQMVLPSFRARFEPDGGQPAVDIGPEERESCQFATDCVPVTSPGVLDVSGAGFSRRATFGSDGTFAVE